MTHPGRRATPNSTVHLLNYLNTVPGPKQEPCGQHIRYQADIHHPQHIGTSRGASPAEPATPVSSQALLPNTKDTKPKPERYMNVGEKKTVHHLHIDWLYVNCFFGIFLSLELLVSSIAAANCLVVKRKQRERESVGIPAWYASEDKTWNMVDYYSWYILYNIVNQF